MDPDRWAATYAERLLRPVGQRWEHTEGVVRSARVVSQVLTPPDRSYLVAAAYLHDVGYAPAVVDTGFHPIDGARHLRALGHERLADLVAYHSSAVVEAETRGLANELRAFVQERSAAAEALTYCDMITDPSGAPVTFEHRVGEVCQRYGEHDVVSRSLRVARPELAAMVQRMEQRLREAGVLSPQPM
jgi:hypothetical protein